MFDSVGNTLGPDDEAPRPIDGGARMASIDTLRGVAVLGILVMNIGGMGLAAEAYGDPTVDGSTTGAPFWAWWAAMVFVEGSMRAIFSMLFGAGVVLLTSRAGETIATADVYYRRTIWLVIFGIVHAYLLLWPGDILYLYGMVGLFLFPLRNAPPRRLAMFGGVILVLLSIQGAGLSYSVRQLYPRAMEAQALLGAGRALTVNQQAALDAWQASPVHVPTHAQIAEQMELRRGNYLDNLRFVAPLSFEFETTAAYMRLFWDALSMMLFGMALFRWGVFDASRSFRDYTVMAVVGLGVGLVTNYYETTTFVSSGFNPAYSFITPTYDVGRMGCAVGYIGLVMLVCRSGVLPRVRSTLAAVGRMALTNYISQTIICNFIFFGVGLGLVGQLQRHELYYVVAGVWLFQLVVSPVWLRRFRYGPLEWLWRSLTYRRRQPMALAD